MTVHAVHLNVADHHGHAFVSENLKRAFAPGRLDSPVARKGKHLAQRLAQGDIIFDDQDSGRAHKTLLSTSVASSGAGWPWHPPDGNALCCRFRGR